MVHGPQACVPHDPFVPASVPRRHVLQGRTSGVPIRHDAGRPRRSAAEAQFRGSPEWLVVNDEVAAA
jgi:hypothetical protein